MEGDVEMYKTICRLCLSSEDSDKLVSLIEYNSARGISCYGESVMRFAQISIEKDDKLPKNMCQKCVYLLKCAIYFKFKCEASERIFKQWTDTKVVKKRKQRSSAKKTYRDPSCKEYIADLNHTGTSSSSRATKIAENCAEILQKDDGNDHLNNSFIEDSFPAEDHLDSSINMTQDDSSDILDIIENNPIAMSTNTSKDKQNDPIKFKARRVPRKKGEKIVCEVCNKVLANQLTYDHHIQYHYGCKYICEHCGKGFPVLSRLQMHLVNMHGTGPCFRCQYCSYKGPNRVSLTEHIRLHTGERPFTCEKCGLTFRRRNIWKKHLIHHSEKTVQCTQCPRKFFTVADMKAHCNNIHERVYMYSCHKCDATYAKTDSVRKHLLERHGIPREMQGKIVRINRGKPINVVEP